MKTSHEGRSSLELIRFGLYAMLARSGFVNLCAVDILARLTLCCVELSYTAQGVQLQLKPLYAGCD